jgi:signal transduction histidine kinase
MITRGPIRFGVMRMSAPVFLRVYLVAGAAVLAMALLLYFHSLARRVEGQAENTGDLLANVIAFTTLAVGDSDTTMQRQFRHTIRDMTMPVVVTDVNGRPLAWNPRVGADTLSMERLLGEDLDHPSPELARILDMVRSMDRRHDRIPMYEPGAAEPAIFLHYGSPALVNELRWIPWITIGVAALFGFTALLIIRSMKRAEQGFIWAGMAKESAHQMGTPISSLMGWMEVLKDEVTFRGEEAAVPRELFEELVGEIDQDAERLNRVAARFSQIGSRPKLEAASVVPTVTATVEYFRRRFPQGIALELREEGEVPPVRLNAELLGWVLENLIKNAQNAVESDGGRVEVRIGPLPDARGVGIWVKDNGRGVAAGMEKHIFRPGVSTRQRGWGLGLPLSRRIVEEYHGGRLDLVWTEPGQGSEFRVALPAAPPERVS